MPVEFGVATSTVANAAFVNFSYLSAGGTLPLDIGFVPTRVEFNGGSESWSWSRGLPFGQAYGTDLITTAGVLDILDGSGVASANVGTTTVAAIGILIGSNTEVNSGAALTYRGIAFR